MAKFRKRPVEIEAVQLNWRNWSEVCDFLGGVIGPHNPGRYSSTYSDTCGESTTAEAGWIEITVPTNHGPVVAQHGDWIIKTEEGEVYPCKPGRFADIYVPA